jgi:hypothetical protein
VKRPNSTGCSLDATIQGTRIGVAPPRSACMWPGPTMAGARTPIPGAPLQPSQGMASRRLAPARPCDRPARRLESGCAVHGHGGHVL